MSSFETQMTKLHSDCDYENIFPNKTWKLEDYEELFKYISPGYLVHAECSPGFVVNPDWDEEPMWEPELCSEDEDDDKAFCEVGEHYVEPDDMWEDFADCKGCVSEKDYKEATEEEPEVFDNDKLKKYNNS